MKLLHRILSAALAAFAALCFHLDPAMSAQKNAGDKASKRSTARITSVTRQRVLKEFRDSYRAPAATKTVRLYHAGVVRNSMVERDARKIPAQNHRVIHIALLEDCGIKTKDIWDVSFYRLESEWIFQGIKQISSNQITKTGKKHPAIDDADTKKLVSEAITGNYENISISDITILSKQSRWRLCIPESVAKSRIALSHRDEIRNTLSEYECLFLSVLAYRNGAWEHVNTDCVYRGKQVAGCHIGTMCREISVGSAITSPTDAEAEAILREALADSHAFRQRSAIIEEFSLIERAGAENFGKKIPCMARVRFVIDENRETIAAEGSGRRRSIPVRAVYECLVRGNLIYSNTDNEWEGEIASCCTSAGADCAEPCSGRFGGCRRLGEK